MGHAARPNWTCECGGTRIIAEVDSDDAWAGAYAAGQELYCATRRGVQANVPEWEAAEVIKLRRALKQISLLGGNLPDERLTTHTGANDAVHRGLMYCEARRIAIEAIG